MSKRNRFYQDISDIALYYKQVRKAQQLNLILNFIYTFLILVFIIGSVVSVLSSGTLASLFRTNVEKNFECVSGEIKDNVNTYTDAKIFVELYGGNCSLKQNK